MKNVLLMCAIVATMVFVSLRGLAHNPNVSRIVFDWPPHALDVDEPEDQRAERLERFASTISNAATDRESRSALLVLTLYESRAARYVVENRCADGPRGLLECDEGRAVGPWQLHKAHHLKHDLDAQARRAAALWRYHRRRCGSIEGAFAGYATGGSCSWSEAALRAAKFHNYLRRL